MDCSEESPVIPRIPLPTISLNITGTAECAVRKSEIPKKSFPYPDQHEDSNVLVNQETDDSKELIDKLDYVSPVNMDSHVLIGECSQEVMSILGNTVIKRPTPTKVQNQSARNTKKNKKPKLTWTKEKCDDKRPDTVREQDVSIVDLTGSSQEQDKDVEKEEKSSNSLKIISLQERTECKPGSKVVPSGVKGQNKVIQGVWEVPPVKHSASRFDFLHPKGCVVKEQSTEKWLTAAKETKSKQVVSQHEQNDGNQIAAKTSVVKAVTDECPNKPKKEKVQVSSLVRRLLQRKAQGVTWEEDESETDWTGGDWCFGRSGCHSVNQQGVLDIELSEVQLTHQVAALQRGKWVLVYPGQVGDDSLLEQDWNRLRPLIEEGKLQSCSSCKKADVGCIWVYCFFSQALQVYEELGNSLLNFTRPTEYIVPGCGSVLSR